LPTATVTGVCYILETQAGLSPVHTGDYSTLFGDYNEYNRRFRRLYKFQRLGL